MSAGEILKLENIEQRYAAMKYIGAKNLFNEFKTELISETEKGNKLYTIYDLIPQKPQKILNYKCPSIKQGILEICTGNN